MAGLTPRAEIETEVLPAFLSYYQHFDGYGFWAAIEKSSGTFIGWFHLRPGPGAPTDEPELGYRLRKVGLGQRLRHRGISSRSIHKAFTALWRNAGAARTMAVNVRSRRVMEKAGLTLVRTFHQDWPDRIDGDDEGDVEYALRKADWERA